MSSFGCCFWWFLLGAFLGWFLNYLLCKRCRNKTQETVSHYAPPPAPAAKVADVPAVSAPVRAPAPTKAKPKAKPKAPAKKTAIDLKAARAAGIKIKSADDLTVIEGVGPKINELFKNSGLKTFAQVSTAPVSRMRGILDKGGARFRIANPSTWAKQAKLATNNQWKELKKLQDDLSGGIKK
ncbi:MAG: hypothetical protein V3U89_02395 [Methylophilaceae bacterium]